MLQRSCSSEEDMQKLHVPYNITQSS